MGYKFNPFTGTLDDVGDGANGFVTIGTTQTVSGEKSFIAKQSFSQPTQYSSAAIVSVTDWPAGGTSVFNVYGRESASATATRVDAFAKIYQCNVADVPNLELTKLFGQTSNLFQVLDYSTHYMVVGFDSNGALIQGDTTDPPSYPGISRINRVSATANIGTSLSPIVHVSAMSSGFYNTNVYMTCLATGAGTPRFRINYTDDAGAQNDKTIATLQMASVGASASVAKMFYVATGDVSYFVDGYGAGTYNLRVRTTFLGY